MSFFVSLFLAGRSRTELQQHSSRIRELDRYEAELGELQQANNKMGEQLRKALSGEDEQRATNTQLREALERVREELRSTQVQAERIQQEADRFPRRAPFTHARLAPASRQEPLCLPPQAVAGQAERVDRGKRETAAEIF